MRKGLVRHLLNVGNISYSFGVYLGLSNTETVDLLVGGVYHDIGKFSIEDDILFKIGKLTEKEKEEIMLHPVIGENKLKRSIDININQNIIDICIQHHERVDGKGYPYGLKDTEINKLAKIISLADSYDAMTTNRGYKEGISHEEAIREIHKCLGTQFDERLGILFIELLGQVKTKDDLLNLSSVFLQNPYKYD